MKLVLLNVCPSRIKLIFLFLTELCKVRCNHGSSFVVKTELNEISDQTTSESFL